ncbi:MAG: hypothetical protein EHM41_16890 [Chloroflexi bacterium]|nr:MAG: hypothetical protein EHM41_16890 [Chloroflexota bacterium]
MMKRVLVGNSSRPGRALIQAKFCRSFFCQLRGLTFRRSLPEDEGLLLVQRGDSKIDSSIHMLFVWIPLGVVWINSRNEVVDTRLALPWRPVYVPRQPAKYVLEIHPSRLVEFCKGDRVSIDEARLV